MTRGGCIVCGRRLYFSERVAWPQSYCFPCACVLGIIRLADRTRYRNLASDAAKLEPWWRWTVYVRHALQWSELVQRQLGRDAPWKVATERPP